MMDDIKGALTRKIGPLPAWAWFGIAAVALYLYRRHTESAATQQSQATDTANVGPYGESYYPIQGGNGGGSSGNGGGQPPTIVVNPPPATTKTKPRNPKTKKAHAGKPRKAGRVISSRLSTGGSRAGSGNKITKVKSRPPKSANQKRGQTGDLGSKGGTYSSRVRTDSHQMTQRSRGTEGAPRNVAKKANSHPAGRAHGSRTH